MLKIYLYRRLFDFSLVINKHTAIAVIILERIDKTGCKVLIIMIENGNYRYLPNNFILFHLTRTCIDRLFVFPRFTNLLRLVADASKSLIVGLSFTVNFKYVFHLTLDCFFAFFSRLLAHFSITIIGRSLFMRALEINL